MPASKNITPSLGVDTAFVAKSTDSYRYGEIPLGTVVRGANGRMYVRVQASGVVANDTAGTITEPAFTFAAAGAAPNYTTRAGALAATDRAWVESNAI